MKVHLRQVALVAQELNGAVDNLQAILGINPCYVDPGVAQFGLENTLLALGHDFIEVVAPVEDNTAAGRYLDRRGGDGGYMVICQADSAATQQAVKERALAAGVRVAWEVERPQWHIVQLHPGDMGASFLEIDSDTHNNFTGNWHPAGGTGWEDKVSTRITQRLCGVELQGPDPRALAEHWSAVLGVPAEHAATQSHLSLDNAQLRFVSDVDGRGPGLGGIDVVVADRDAVLRAARERGCYRDDATLMICGTRINLS